MVEATNERGRLPLVSEQEFNDMTACAWLSIMLKGPILRRADESSSLETEKMASQASDMISFCMMYASLHVLLPLGTCRYSPGLYSMIGRDLLAYYESWGERVKESTSHLSGGGPTTQKALVCRPNVSSGGLCLALTKTRLGRRWILH